MEKLFLIQTTTADRWEIIGGNYIVKAMDEEEATSKIYPSLYDNKPYTEKILYIFDITNLDFKNDIYKINDFIIE